MRTIYTGSSECNPMGDVFSISCLILAIFSLVLEAWHWVDIPSVHCSNSALTYALHVTCSNGIVWSVRNYIFNNDSFAQFRPEFYSTVVGKIFRLVPGFRPESSSHVGRVRSESESWAPSPSNGNLDSRLVSSHPALLYGNIVCIVKVAPKPGPNQKHSKLTVG